MASKKQTTMAKLTRERKVKEKREKKAEKKAARADGSWVEPEAEPISELDDEPFEPDHTGLGR